MADDRDARIAQLEAENAALREREAALTAENVALSEKRASSDRALAEARDQQAATSEILSLIASSPLDVRRVLDAVAERAARLCDTYEALIHRVEGDTLPLAASYPPPNDGTDMLPPTFRRASVAMAATGSGVPIEGSFSGRAVSERRTIHIHDSALVSDEEYPVGRAMYLNTGQRTVLATPLLRHGVAIGAILLRRMEVRPFTAQQIALLETFAAQAAIAIDNSQMFRELEQRNGDLLEALERQTATAEVLRAIASAPADAQRVLDSITESAVRLCSASDGAIWRIEGGGLVVVAAHGASVEHTLTWQLPIDRDSVAGRCVLDRQSVRIDDLLSAEADAVPRSQDLRDRVGYRSIMCVPLLREGDPIGVFTLVRVEPKPFSEQEADLIRSFADQAVIAIENARLFQELERRNAALRESQEQQAVAAEVLRVIASSPADLARCPPSRRPGNREGMPRFASQRLAVHRR